MSDSVDSYLGKVVKRWAARRQPPQNGRARLIWEAAHLSTLQKPEGSLFTYRRHPAYSPSTNPDWSYKLFSWAVFYPFKEAW